jgi:branched-chain amino acid transport system ATP-binding protein
MSTDIPPLLEVRSASAAYGRTVALRDANLEIGPGTVVGLLGANGAGKTTMLRVSIGLLRLTGGSIFLNGEDITRMSPHQRTREGICLIPEGRGIFRSLTVRENLDLYLPADSKHARDFTPAIDAFPVLGRRLSQRAGNLSGGEQQMLAVAKAFLCKPRLVMADELSLGLAPLIIDQIYASLRVLNAAGIGLLIVEQYVHRILDFADRLYVMSRSQIAWSGVPSQLKQSELVDSYLGEDLAEGDFHDSANVSLLNGVSTGHSSV